MASLISIHALRVEGDKHLGRGFGHYADFYPRPPGGGRQGKRSYANSAEQFLSTPSGWRATVDWVPQKGGGEISIHALRVEGD